MQARRRTPTTGATLELLYPDQQSRTQARQAVFAPEILPLPQPARAPSAPGMWQLGVSPLSSLPWTRALGPTTRGWRGATLSAYPDANDTLSALHCPWPIHRALNSCTWSADLQLGDFHHLNPGPDHFISVIVRNDSTGWRVGRQSC
ncbi:hypothetical protein BDR22DRAFT_528378 [Usnea florida]